MLALAHHLLVAAEGGDTGVPEEKSNDNFLVPDATFVVELLLFLVVLFIVWRFVVPPVSAAMAERKEKIARSATDTEAAARALNEAQAAYEQAMGDARAEVTRLREQARAQHKAQVDEVAAAAQANADEITSRARAQLAAEREQALSALRADVESRAADLAGRVVGEPV